MSEKRFNQSIEELSIKCTQACYSLIMKKVENHPDPHEVLYYAAVFLAAKAVSGNGRLDAVTTANNLVSFLNDANTLLEEHFKIKTTPKPKQRMDA